MKSIPVSRLFYVFSLVLLILFSSFVFSKPANIDGDAIAFEKDLKEKEIITECIDSDEEDYFNLGTVILKKGDKEKSSEDICLDESSLLEYVCSNINIKEVKVECEYGCSEGRCLTCEETNSCNAIEEITACEDGTKLDECNQDGYRCVDLELIEDQTCVQESPQPVPLVYEDKIGKTRYVYSGDSLIATDYADQLFYYITDYLGSSRIVLDDQGTVINDYDYYPFGEQINSEIDGRYSGKEYDEETGMYYYGARYYSPDEGRFTQTDPIENPESSYSSFKESPMRYIDPDGRYVVDKTSSSFRIYYPSMANSLSKNYGRVYDTLSKDRGVFVFLRAENAYNKIVSDKFKNNPSWGAYIDLRENVDNAADIFVNPDFIQEYALYNSKYITTKLESSNAK